MKYILPGDKGGALLSLPSRGAWIEIHVCLSPCLKFAASLPSRGAWIEIWYVGRPLRFHRRRSPHGERGLKSLMPTLLSPTRCSRSPHGERGLKLQARRQMMLREKCRSPHGERGLKFHGHPILVHQLRSLPSRGAWIEIHSGLTAAAGPPSLPSRGAWIEI